MSHFIASDGRRIAYADTGGTGPAVLCLAGLTRSMIDYADLAAHLAPGHRVIRTDYRGRGDSGWAEDAVAEYTPLVEARDVIELLDHLDIEQVSLVGTSRGGLIGMLLGATQPDRIGALVLNDIGPVVEMAGLEFIMTYLGIDPGFPDFAAAAARMKAVYARDFPDLDDAAWAAWARRSYRDVGGVPKLSYDPALRDATAAALESAPPDLWAVFDGVRAPMLAIRGSNSDLLTKDTLAEMAARRPGLACVTIANRGHVPFLDELAALDAIDNFLAEHAQ